MLAERLRELNVRDAAYATQFAQILLEAAQAAGATDVHLQPVRHGLDVRWRLDGVLQPLGCFPRGEAADVVVRLKVMAGLLTYKTDVPQEGRIRGEQQAETRISTFPTLFGERAVVRIFPDQKQLRFPQDLGLPRDVHATLCGLLNETSGAIILSGPSGSGKTTTIYACLRELVRRSNDGRSLITLEDPVEVVVDGISQSQIDAAGGFDFASGLRSLMRQDPEVIMIGEIRDRETAEAAFAASLTGHLVLTTFHAGSAAAALARLADLSVEPYMLRSGLRAVLSQRLLRRLCSCAAQAATESQRLGLPVRQARLPAGCESCWQTGYRGRLLTAELVTIGDGPLADAILARADAQRLATVARQSGLITHWQRACAAVESLDTSPQEVRRVLGFAADEPTPAE
jgi:general secretion pathway protein E